MERREQVRLGLVVIGAMILSAAIHLFTRDSGYPVNTNVLSVGSSAVNQRIEIPFFETQELSGRSTDEILALRRQVISNNPELLQNDYAPFAPIFEGVKPGAGWQSEEGYYYGGPGAHSLSGPSYEGLTLINPFVLISPEFLGLSIKREGNLVWDRTIAEPEQRSSDFLLRPVRRNLVWNPAERTVEITYDIRDYIAAVNKWTLKPVDKSQAYFAVSTYNAQDLGLNYIYLDLERSENISNPKQPEKPVFMSDVLLYSPDGCGNPEGCNHRSEFIPELDTIKISDFPAKAVFKLFKYAQKSHTNPAAIYYTMHFE